MDCSPPGSSVSAISQTRILQRVAIPFSRGSSRQGIKPGSPAWQADSLPPEPPGKLQDVTAETQNRLHLIPRPDEGPWTSHPADPDLSFLFCKQERRVPPFKATREGEMRTDLCGRTRRLSFRSVQGSAQGHRQRTPPSLQLPPRFRHHDRLLALRHPSSVSWVHRQSASALRFQNLCPEDHRGLQVSAETGVPTWAITLLIPSWAAAYLHLTLTFGSRDEVSAHLICLIISCLCGAFSPPLPSLCLCDTHTPQEHSVCGNHCSRMGSPQWLTCRSTSRAHYLSHRPPQQPFFLARSLIRPKRR